MEAREEDVVDHQITEAIGHLGQAAAVSNLPELERLSTVLDKLQRPRARGHALRARAIKASVQGQSEEALRYAFEALQIFTEIADADGEARALNSIGNDYMGLGDYSRSLTYYQQALSIFQERDDELGVALIVGNIGNVYAYSEQSDRALEYYKQALEIFERRSSQSGIARLQGNIGMVHTRRAERDLAMPWLTSSLQRYTDLDDKNGVARVIGYLFELDVAVKDMDAARGRLELMDAIDIDEPEHRISRLIYHAMMQQHDQDHDAARETIRLAQQIAAQHQVREREIELWKQLRDLAYADHDLEAYVECNAAMRVAEDALRGTHTVRSMAAQELEMRYAKELQQRERERDVLYSTLPRPIADRLIRGEEVEDEYAHAAVLFADIVGFTARSSVLETRVVSRLLEQVFIAFDAICKQNGVTKVKTIGDSYMCYKGDGYAEQNAESVAQVGLAMLRIDHLWPEGNSSSSDRVTLRIGAHIGPVSAGVLGSERLQYDIWGDTVNVASRMESTGEPGRIQVSEAFASALRAREEEKARSEEREGSALRPLLSGLRSLVSGLRFRGETAVKGKGTMKTYWLDATGSDL